MRLNFFTKLTKTTSSLSFLPWQQRAQRPSCPPRQSPQHPWSYAQLPRVRDGWHRSWSRSFLCYQYPEVLVTLWSKKNTMLPCPRRRHGGYRWRQFRKWLRAVEHHERLVGYQSNRIYPKDGYPWSLDVHPHRPEDLLVRSSNFSQTFDKCLKLQ